MANVPHPVLKKWIIILRYLQFTIYFYLHKLDGTRLPPVTPPRQETGRKLLEIQTTRAQIYKLFINFILSFFDENICQNCKVLWKYSKQIKIIVETGRKLLEIQTTRAQIYKFHFIFFLMKTFVRTVRFYGNTVNK